jgi:hypothetical protein
MRQSARTALAVVFAATFALAGLSAVSGAGASGTPPAVTSSTALLPPAGSVYTGVSSGAVSSFTSEVGKHPAVYGEFVTWGQSIHFAFNDAASSHARLMLHIGTGPLGHGVITPAQIAQGHGDAYLVTLSQLIASHGQPVYIRLMPEMNNANNPYCAINSDGSSRGADYTPAQFIAAWRRVVTVLRGGPVATIDSELAALGQPRLHGIAAAASIAQSPIAFVWTPETAGTPDLPDNSAANYYPGNAYVDWVGTDFYSKFPNFAGLDAFYKEFRAKPFAFGEWAIWGGDNPAFVAQFFAWINTHKRVQMIVYNQGFTTTGPFSLSQDPQSAAAIRGKLAPERYLAFAGA